MCTESAHGDFSAELSVLKGNLLVKGFLPVSVSVYVTNQRTNSVIMSRGCQLSLSHVGHMLVLSPDSSVVNAVLVRSCNITQKKVLREATCSCLYIQGKEMRSSCETHIFNHLSTILNADF